MKISINLSLVDEHKEVGMDEEFKTDVINRLKRIENKVGKSESITTIVFNLGLYLIALGVGFLALGGSSKQTAGGLLIGSGFLALIVVVVRLIAGFMGTDK